MALTPGTRIGTFEITGRLGSGGMGEVYRARDTSLGRDVAIKVLSEAFARDPDRLARFEREAHLLASLNHPNIGTIYGIHDGPAGIGGHSRALVLELIEGPTLADRLAHGAVPLDEARRLAQQIADALDAAHERGIVHRDLKPANIKVQPDGTAKVLDFGIAKASVAGGGLDLHNTIAVTAHATQGGLILGTPGYMSPEQARGQEVDKRTDIWAFGCVLFAMLTGRTPFDGDTLSDVIAATLTNDPDWNALPPDVPEPIRRVLHRCLQRDLRRRLRDIGDVCADLDEPITPRPASIGAAATKSVSFQRLTDLVGVNESPALSPDGRMVAFVAPVDGRRQIWIRMLSGGAPLRVTHDEIDHESPRWTADGSSIVYYVGPDATGELGMLWEVSALGGGPRPLVEGAGGGDCSRDGRRIAMFHPGDDRAELMAFSLDRGSTERIALGPLGCTCESPRWSPDDKWIVFQTRGIGRFSEHLHIVPAAGGQAPVLIARASAIRGVSWLPDNSGVVYSSSAGSTVPYPPTFNLRRVARDGTGDRALTFGDASFVAPDVHSSGKILASRIHGQSDIWRFPIGGSPAENTRNAVRVTRQSGQVQTPSVSPDGTEVVYLSDNGGHGNLWVTKADGTGAARQITFERDPATTIGVPTWSPVDKQIAFVVSRDRISIFVVNSDGRNLRELVPRGLGPCWSPDGAWMYYSPLDNNEEWRIEKVPASGGPPVVVRTDVDTNSPTVGRTTLYYGARSQRTVGRWEWELRRASPEDGPSEVLTHVAGTRIPVNQLFVSMTLSPDGGWLALPLLAGATANICVMPVEGGSFTAVTDFGDRATLIARQVSWAPDGQSIYAAVADVNADIVLLDGLI
jgi:eukaryotic-like serine/threonine-protein kinase